MKIKIMKATFFILLIFLTQIVLAQAIEPTVNGVGFTKKITPIIETFTSLIFVLIIILILLSLGGVIRLPRRKPSLFYLVFIILIALAFLLPQFVEFPLPLEVPKNFKIYPLPTYMKDFIVMLGLPSEWAYVPAIIYLFILPFAAIYALVWAFLTTLEIFVGPQSTKVNRLLAFIITFLTIPVGAFTRMVWVLFSFMGAWSVAIFAIMFIVGIFYRGGRYVKAEHLIYKATAERKREADEFRDWADEQIEGLPPETQSAARDEMRRYYNRILKGEISPRTARARFQAFIEGLRKR